MTVHENPKDVEALKVGKAPLDYLEPVADEAISRALKFGGDKYGIRNYTLSPIAARVYVAAIRRHLSAWLTGEDVAEDSGLHHLAHVGANVHVALAAIEAGTFIDDRHEAIDQDKLAHPPRVLRGVEVPEVLDECPLGGSCYCAHDFVSFRACRADCAGRR